MAPAPRRNPSASMGKIAMFGIDVVTLIAGGFKFAFERLAHDHPQRVAGGSLCPPASMNLSPKGCFGRR